MEAAAPPSPGDLLIAAITQKVIEQLHLDGLVPIRDDDVIDGVPRAAEFLHMSPSTIRTLASHGEIPCRRIGHRMRFSKVQLSMWLAGRDVQ